MKKHLAFLAFIVTAVTGFAAPGSYQVVTLALTNSVTESNPQTLLSNGNKVQSNKVVLYKITNVAILSEAQRIGLLTEGSLTGWKIVLVWDQDGNQEGFYAFNGLSQVSLDSIIRIDPTMGEDVESGKWVRNTSDRIISGSKTNTYAQVIGLSDTVDDYLGMATAKIKYTIKDMGVFGVVWLPGAFRTSAIAGYGTDGSIWGGTISCAKGIAVMNTGSIFLN